MSTVGAIVDYAEKENTDIIILGNSGRTGFKKILLGSTCSRSSNICSLSCSCDKMILILQVK